MADQRARREKRKWEQFESSEEIILLPPQMPHIARLQNILQRHSFALDLSALGSGKMFCSSHIAIKSGLPHVIVIAPVSVQPKWQEMHEKYGVPIKHNLSYCGLRSIKGKQPKHELLSRRDYTVVAAQPRGPPRSIEKTDFEVTDTFKVLVKEGVLLILDEMQHLKNVSSQFAACQTLIRAITDSCAAGGRSRVLLLSGSPIDKQEQAVTLFRTVSIMRHAELCKFNPGTRTMELRGVSEIVDFCRSVDNLATERILATRRYWYCSESVMRPMCYTLFQEVLKPNFSNAMLPPALAGTLHKWNAFYRVDDEADRTALLGGVRALESAVHYNRDTGQVSMAEGVDSLRALCAALVRIENAKIRTFARVALKALRSDPQRKVVICLNYTDSLQRLKALLANYTPLVLNGAVPKHERKRIIDDFQVPSDEHRVLLGNASVCSTGIDLDDKHGAWPRLALISPNYSTLTLYQLGHRFQRMDTKSDGTVHMVFAKHAHELPILNALARKGSIMRETTPEQAEAGIKFPGEYPSWVEEDREIALMRAGFEGLMRNVECRKWARGVIGSALLEWSLRPGGVLYRLALRRFENNAT